MAELVMARASRACVEIRMGSNPIAPNIFLSFFAKKAVLSYDVKLIHIPCRLSARISPFHGEERGSIPRMGIQRVW
jgi:hypothetical protein